ncbi:MAG TPA: 30S ribosomal protein S1, partial [Streptosporangiaceae bacterium]|nr:30S ribosomal protein S1 [Streptosporangiaceae bacterium]
DLDRRRISLSLKQANEGTIGEALGEDFDPTLYGMPATYDEQGNYEYPEGFDAETGEWLDGFDAQREEWERQYAEARTRFEAHRHQVEEARKADSEAIASGEDGAPAAASSSSSPASSTSSPRGGSRSSSGPASSGGALASDEALAALRDKLSGNQE